MEICLIDAEGLDEEIRCEMCRNPMRSDTGCDGGCTYDEKLYEKIVHLLNERIKPLPDSKESSSTHKALDTISRRVAIDALDALCDRECEYSKKQRSVMCGACHLGSAFDVVEQLPSAQSETEERKEESAQNVSKEDLISRKAAIEHLKKRLYETEFNSTAEYPYYQEIADNRMDVWMNEVPSAQSEPQWIPCSERLPEVNGDYLVTGRQGAVNKRKYEDGRWYGNWAVLAWMPLPERYGGGEE